MNIQFHIERLVLDGLPMSRREGAAVRAAVERELARLLTADGLASGLAAGGMMPRLTAASVTYSPGGDPIALGTEIAQSVHGSLGK